MTNAWSPSVPRSAARAVTGARDARIPARVLIALSVLCWLASFVVGFTPALGALTVVGFAAAVIGVYRPQVGLLGVGILCTLDAVSRDLLFTGGLWRWNTFNYWLLAVLVAFPFVVLRWRGGTIRTLQALLALLVIGLVISPTPFDGVQHVLSIGAVLGLMVYFSRADLDAGTVQSLALTCGVTAALASLSFLVHQDTLPYVNPNSVAYLPLAGLFAICLAFTCVGDRRSSSIPLVLLAAANLAAVLLSGSRGGMLIAAGCALLVAGAVRGVQTRLTALVIVVLLGITVSAQFTALQANALHRLRKLVDPHASLAERTSGRSDLLLGGWRIFVEHPVRGVGTGGFSDAWVGLHDVEGVTRFRSEAKAAHAGWIKTLAENGLPGGALLLGYVLSFGIAGWKTRDRGLRRLGLLTTTVLALAFVSTEFQMKALWFLAAGTTFLLQRRPGSSP